MHANRPIKPDMSKLFLTVVAMVSEQMCKVNNVAAPIQRTVFLILYKKEERPETERIE
jgi:hypothetical protein